MIHALGRQVTMVTVISAVARVVMWSLQAQKKGYSGPTLGPKMADKNVRQFSDDKKKAGSAVIGLQMGSNKGANQSGMTFGQTRHM